MKPPIRFTPAQIAALPLPTGRLSAQAFETNEVELRYYAPRDADTQSPHSRDELYFVIAGHGSFRCGDKIVKFETGDVLFAGAGEAHRFESFTPDFATWVLFYGEEAK